LVAEFVEQKQHTKSRQELNQIPATNNENIKFIELFDRLNTIGEQGKEVKNMSAADELVVRNVKQSSTKVSVCAESVLTEAEKEKYQRFPETINLQSGLKMTSGPSGSEITEEQEDLTGLDQETQKELSLPSMEIVPNPFTGATTLYYSLPDNRSNAKVVVYDLLGSQVMDIPLNGSVQIDLQGNKSGIYFVYLMNNNEVLITKKAVLVQ